MTFDARVVFRTTGSVARHLARRNGLRGAVLLILIVTSIGVGAGQPDVEKVILERGGSGWTAHVTVRHDDSGWDHYADAWRIVDPDGNTIGTRTLYHPHESEQPFTRSLSGISMPDSLPWVEVQAHDKVHGWGVRVRVNLGVNEGEKFRIRRRD